MRAVFTVDLPANHEHKYPDNLQIAQLLRSFGWEPMDVCILEDETVDHGPGQFARFARNLPGNLSQSDYCVVNSDDSGSLRRSSTP